MGWPLVVGGSIWVVFIWSGLSAWRNRNTVDPQACQRCRHEDGLDDRRRHCGNVDSYSGWGRDACRCTNDYHWNYESVRN